jgi:hypothetical protein
VQITNSICETHGFELEAPARRHAFALKPANFMEQNRGKSIFDYFSYTSNWYDNKFKNSVNKMLQVRRLCMLMNTPMALPKIY